LGRIAGKLNSHHSEIRKCRAQSMQKSDTLPVGALPHDGYRNHVTLPTNRRATGLYVVNLQVTTGKILCQPSDTPVDARSRIKRNRTLRQFLPYGRQLLLDGGTCRP
jgi:hypothetical protein